MDIKETLSGLGARFAGLLKIPGTVFSRLRESGGLGRVLGGRVVGIGAGAVLLAAVIYYPVGMIMVHKVDDNPSLTWTTPQGGSEAVGATIALLKREVDQNGWVANDPWFMPTSMLDNMPNFQQGMVGALSRFALEMTDQIGRVRGSSQADADLEKAAGLLKYPGNVWIFDFSTSLAPTATSEAQYRSATRALERYNERLSGGTAVFERRADNLLGTLDRFAADLGSLSAVVDKSLSDLSTFSTKADDVFYQNKGRLYAYFILLKAMERDFSNVIVEKEVQSAWEQMLVSIQQAATMDPPVVINGSPDALILPSHLAAQGFYLLRARTQLREIANVLLK